MDRRIGLLAGLTALFALGSAHAQTCPTTPGSRDVNTDTGHVFKVFVANGISWAAAQACANEFDTAPPVGYTAVKGHLATITSQDEDVFVERLRLTAGLERSEVWVGGEKIDGKWRWINNEGPIETPAAIVTGSYQNWLDYPPGDPYPDEPNNLGGSEYWLAVGLRGNLSAPLDPEGKVIVDANGNVIGWNDEGNLGNIGGFVVEYDYPLTLANGGCEPTSAGGTTCNTVEGQTITLPPTTLIDQTKPLSISFSSYLFRDPRVDGNGVCSDRRALTLFEDEAFNVTVRDRVTGDLVEVSGKLVIPAYLCGSPNFVVVRTQAENITIPRGVVVTESETSEVVPGNLPIYTCDSTIPKPAKSGQTQDVGVWQSLDATEMWEDNPASPVPRFAGTAAELTTGCASTLLKTRTKSNFVVGLHIDFGPNFSFGSAEEYNEFIALTQYKISLVRQSVVEARRIGTISDANGRAMLSQLDSAAGSLASNNPVGAAKKIQDFLKKVNSSTYSTSLTNPFNFNGDHLSRGENILFTLQHKVIPFKPVL